MKGKREGGMHSQDPVRAHYNAKQAMGCRLWCGRVHLWHDDTQRATR